jgi:phenylacetic acid degradation operon negative regulatory protein
MHARSALFDLYGDHLRGRGSQAPVAALVRLLEPVGIAEPAVRTAISRMVGQRWLEPVRLPAGRGYRATDRAIRRVEEAGLRIYRRETATWDGTWHLVVVAPAGSRATRERLRADLGFLGYAELAPQTWVSPFPRSGVDEVLSAAGTTAHLIEHAEIEPAPVEAWDLDAIASAYEEWRRATADLLETEAQDDRDAFAIRFHLVHEWRKFLFTDPGLPERLLPRDWPGQEAAVVFSTHADRLKPAADRFVQECLAPDR